MFAERRISAGPAQIECHATARVVDDVKLHLLPAVAENFHWSTPNGFDKSTGVLSD